MLHIGETQVNLGMPNAKVLYFGETKMGPIIGESGEPTPSGTILHQYDRVDGKATVAGFWTDGNGQRYAVCVADAAYRTAYIQWGTSRTSYISQLPDYDSHNTQYKSQNARESGSYNTDAILQNYSANSYPAFKMARDALTITIDKKTFTSCLPNYPELLKIFSYRSQIDSRDPTLSSYPTMSLASWNFGGNSNETVWSSTECTNNQACCRYSYAGGAGYKDKYGGVCPIIEIPVDENGKVM